jgi:hypothetical protein
MGWTWQELMDLPSPVYEALPSFADKVIAAQRGEEPTIDMDEWNAERGIT